MFNRTIAGAAGALAVMLLAACASAPEQSAETREQKYYRTGSNIAVKDYGAENIEVRGAEIVNPINRPMGSVMNKKPGG
jgi:hypothetical protein